MTLPDRLAALMRQRGIRSQLQLARRAAVAQSTIHRILKVPGYVPTRPTLVRLATALDTTPFWLSDGVVAVSVGPDGSSTGVIPAVVQAARPHARSH